MHWTVALAYGRCWAQDKARPRSGLRTLGVSRPMEPAAAARIVASQLLLPALALGQYYWERDARAAAALQAKERDLDDARALLHTMHLRHRPCPRWPPRGRHEGGLTGRVHWQGSRRPRSMQGHTSSRRTPLVVPPRRSYRHRGA
jgi:hypothetical protein